MHHTLAKLILPFLTFVSVATSEVSTNRIKDAPPFLGNYLIEDSCQFQLCGSAYSAEWNGQPPLSGSCSGDCSLLAITLNTNKFHREFLWSSCSRMCGAKFPADRQAEYKSRFLCMEGCYSSYSLVAPHHNIARYCMQAVCKPTQPQMPQIDCFERCTGHVSSSLPESTWRVWANAIASSCTNTASNNTNLESRLACGDRAVWDYVSRVQQKAEEEHAALCLDSLCDSEVKCGVSCLNHIHNLSPNERSEWVECSTGFQCTTTPTGTIRNDGDWHQRQACADSCLLARAELREKERLARLRKESQPQLQLQYASTASRVLLATQLITGSLLLLYACV